jgi:tetratricopeptide (TPR) repeat protein
MTRMRWGLLGAAMLVATPVAAQQFTDSTLALAVRLVTEGQGDSARALVRARLNATSRTDSLYPEVLFAAGMVAEQLDSALAAFRRVSIEYSESRWADDALLRIGQLSFAARDLPTAQRAIDRLLTDYPLSDVRAAAAYWAARIRLEEGQVPEACPYLRQAADSAGEDVELANRARYYLQRCSSTTADTTRPAGPRTIFAVQVAAVGNATAADDMMQRLQAAGFTSRVVRDGDLFKVRVGEYRSRADAQAAQAELRKKIGGSPFIVEESR